MSIDHGPCSHLQHLRHRFLFLDVHPCPYDCTSPQGGGRCKGCGRSNVKHTIPDSLHWQAFGAGTSADPLQNSPSKLHELVWESEHLVPGSRERQASHTYSHTPSHPLTLTPLHPHSLTPSHPHTLAPSHTIPRPHHHRCWGSGSATHSPAPHTQSRTPSPAPSHTAGNI